FAAADALERARELGAPSRAVAIDPHDARAGEAGGERLLDPLCAAPHRLQVDVTAGRACARNRPCGAAVMAVQTPVRGVQHEPSGAALAARVPAAGFAGEDG